MALALAIDLGTTNLKVGLVNLNGEVVALQKAAIPTQSNVPGAAEHDPQLLQNLILQLSSAVLQTVHRQQVRYIVASTYHFGLMLLDAQRQPLTGMTLLTDTRFQKTFARFKESFADIDVYERSGCPLLGQYVLPRLFYFQREAPQLFQKAMHFVDSKAFLFEWLTGENITDTSIATATQLYNVRQFDWDETILERIGLAAHQFPRIANGTRTLRPLRKAIAEALDLQNAEVLLGVYDGGALAVGLSGLAPGIGILNVGTTAMLRLPSAAPAFDTNDNKRIQAYALYDNFFLNGGALNNAALPLDWMRQHLFDLQLNEPALLETSAAAPLFSLPYLTGERDSLSGPFASGVFFGMRRHHSRIDFTRAILEGVAYSMKYMNEALESSGQSMQELRMGGGGTQVAFWPQIFADVLGVPITVPDGEEVALTGSAMLAFTAGGQYPNLLEAARSMNRSGIHIEPDRERMQHHQKHYGFFKKLRETMGHLYLQHADYYS